MVFVFKSTKPPMTRNITFTADDALIDLAREISRADNTTLNEQFRLWLEAYTRKRRAERGMEVIERMGKYVSTGGKKLMRDELNERG